MNFAWATLYGFIQGVTEFLPVSSSGHLALIPFFAQIQDPGVLFDLMMHLGTALAVILYFHKEVGRLINEALHLCINRKVKEVPFLFNFMIATFFSFVLILVLKKFALEYGRSPNYIAMNLVLFGVIMYWADQLKEKKIKMEKELRLKESVLIGLSQSLAIFPGVSRSGITLTTARFLGLSREEAGRFSFLLSLPVILGSIVFKIPDMLEAPIGDVSWGVTFYGVVCSFFFGLITIHYFLKLISKIGLVYFSVYRIIFGGVLFYFLIK